MRLIAKYLLLLFVSWVPYLLQAQVSSTFGRMETRYAKGCAPFTVNIRETDNLGAISRTYTYEQDINTTSDTFHTYTSPGRYEIIQLLGEDIVPKTDTLIIEVLENFKPFPTLAKCDQSRALIRFPDSLYDAYLLISGTENFTIDPTNSWQEIIDFADTLNLTVRGVYQDGAPNCQSFDSTYVRTPSATIENPIVEFTFLCSDLFTADIQFTGNPDQLYQIRAFDDVNSPISSLESNWRMSGFQLNDISTLEGATELCVQIDAISACDSTIENSYQYCESLAQLNEPLDFAYASYQGESIEVSFDTPTIGSISIQQKVGNEIIDVFSADISPVIFEDLSIDDYYAFDLIYNSQCPNDSIRYTISPPTINSSRIGINNYEIILEPATYHSLSQNVTSSDLFLFGLGDTLRFDQGIDQIRLSNEQGTFQELLFIESLGDLSLSSNKIALAYEYYVYVPDAFTPNDDGINDELQLFGLPSENFTFKVFNRWGEKVFETQSTDNFWRGRLNNGHIVEGTYVYLLKFYNSVGELFTQQGSFAVIRD